MENKPKRTRKSKITPSNEIELELSLDISQDVKPEKDLKSSGLGDVISKLTKKLGFDECDGCKARKMKFNRMFNFLNPVRFLNDDEIKYVIESYRNEFVVNTLKMFKLYNDVFNERVEPCTCPGLVKVMVERLYNFAVEQVEIQTKGYV